MNDDPAQDIRRFLSLLFQPGDVFEVRAPGCRERPDAKYAFTCSGYFTHAALEQAAAQIAELDRATIAPGIYVTLNPIAPALLARSANRIKARVRETTQDKDVVRRRWLLIDVDPVRPSGVSATDAELERACQTAQRIVDEFASSNWPEPVVVMSGNGYHLLYRVDLPAEDGGLVQRVLAALADRFSDDEVAVDRSVYNPARITKIVGTVSRKGDNLRGVAGLEDRPHRRARLVSAPDEVAIVPAVCLEALAGPSSETAAPHREPASAISNPAAGGPERFDHTPAGVRRWLEAHGVTVKAERRNGDSTLLLLERCPINPEIESTGGSDIAVLVGDDGKLAYCNKHNRGQHYTWHDLRRALEPDYEPPPTEGGGVDLSGFLPLQACQNPPETSTAEPPWSEPRSVRQLVAEFPRLRPPVIRGLLREGETMNIIAPPKTGKSWLVLGLTMAVATGRPWLGTFDTVTGRVLILDNELHRETIAHRVPQVAAALGIGMDELGDTVHVRSLRGKLCDLFALAPKLKALGDRYKMIVLDSFYRFMPPGISENDNAAMAGLYNLIDNLASCMKCCFVLIHHTTKGNQSAKAVTDVGAGAGSQSRATDTHLVMRPHEEPGAVVLDAAVRSWPPIEPLVLRWNFPVWTPAPELDPAALRQVHPRRSRSKQSAEDDRDEPAAKWDAESFVAAFVDNEPRTRESILQRAVESGLSEWKAGKLLRRAEAAGLIHRWVTARNQPISYALTPPPDGEEVIA